MDREQPLRNRAHMQRDRARMDQLLRAFLPDGVERITQEHRQVLGALGDTKVQTTETQPQQAWKLLEGVATREPELFAHWRLTLTHDRTVGAV